MTAIPQRVVDAARRLLGLAPIHRHQYKQVSQWCYIDGNLVLERRDRCDCGHETNVRFLLMASAANIADADKRKYSTCDAMKAKP